jgi:hypothetical protein
MTYASREFPEAEDIPLDGSQKGEEKLDDEVK